MLRTDEPLALAAVVKTRSHGVRTAGALLANNIRFIQKVSVLNREPSSDSRLRRGSARRAERPRARDPRRIARLIVFSRCAKEWGEDRFIAMTAYFFQRAERSAKMENQRLGSLTPSQTEKEPEKSVSEAQQHRSEQ